MIDSEPVLSIVRTPSKSNKITVIKTHTSQDIQLIVARLESTARINLILRMDHYSHHYPQYIQLLIKIRRYFKIMLKVNDFLKETVRPSLFNY